MMIKRVAQCLGTLVLIALAIPASAATVSLVPDAAEVYYGDSFTVDLVLNAPDAPGNHPGSVGGKIVIDFDPTLVTFVGFAVNAPAILQQGPSLVPGNPTNVSLWFEMAPTVSTVGTFTFLAVDNPANVGTVATIGIADQDDFFGTFANWDPTNMAFTPTFVGGSIEIVPLPAAAWLMASALGVLAFRRSSRRV
jgi:hypothetical protein